MHVKNNIKAVEDNLQKLITEFEKKYEGTVPPTFIKEEKPVADQPENQDVQ